MSAVGAAAPMAVSCSNCQTKNIDKVLEENSKLKEMIEKMKCWFQIIPNRDEWLKVEFSGTLNGGQHGVLQHNKMDTGEPGNPALQPCDLQLSPEVSRELRSQELKLDELHSPEGSGEPMMQPPENMEDSEEMMNNDLQTDEDLESVIVKVEDSYTVKDEKTNSPEIKRVVIVSRPEGYQCDQCDYSTSTTHNLARHIASKHNGNRYLCDQCAFASNSAYLLKIHKNNKHLGVRFPCEQCEYEATTSGSLKKHKEGRHDKKVNSCDHCEFVTTSASSLKVHSQNKHEGLRFPCDECDHLATTKSRLKAHKDSRHKGIRYPCDECEYAATIPRDLRRHKEYKHLGIRYPCDQCDHEATTFYSLKTHKERKHEGIRRFPCDECEYVAGQLGDLKGHKKNKHK